MRKNYGKTIAKHLLSKHKRYEFEQLFKCNENNLTSRGKYKRIDKVSNINKMLIEN